MLGLDEMHLCVFSATFLRCSYLSVTGSRSGDDTVPVSEWG